MREVHREEPLIPAASPPSSGGPDPAESALAELDPDYYRTNFFLILRTVLARDRHLFHDEELEWLARLEALPPPLQRLYIRLFNRNGPYFRLDRLSYAELPDLDAVARALVVAGFAWRFAPDALPGRIQLQVSVTPMLEAPDPDPLSGEIGVMCLETAHRAYLLPELCALARAHGIKGNKRDVVVNALLGLEPAVLAHGLLQLGPLVLLRHAPLLERVHRLFFLHGGQDASTLVTVSLALVRYPDYRVWRTRPVFVDRKSLDAYLYAQRLELALEQALHRGDSASARSLGDAALAAFLASSPGSGGFLERYSARYVHARTALRHLEQLERVLGREETAAHYTRLLDASLPASFRGETWNRLALHWERCGWQEASLEACQQALQEPSTRRGARLELTRRRDRLLKRLKRLPEMPVRSPVRHPSPPQPLEPTREVSIRRPILVSGQYQRMRFADPAGAAQDVESTALLAYRSVGVDGLYTENAWFTTLCGILFWDIFFADVPDVFQSPYQDAPLDLNTDAFYETRAPLIDARLEQLRRGSLEMLHRHHRQWYGVSARGVQWERFPLESLELGCVRLGGERLAGLLGHLLADYRHHRRGLPDLLCWRSDRHDLLEPGSAAAPALWGLEGYQAPDSVWFAEVKSPRDRLSADQRAWMGAIRGLGMHVEVVRILGEDLPPGTD